MILVTSSSLKPFSRSPLGITRSPEGFSHHSGQSTCRPLGAVETLGAHELGHFPGPAAAGPVALFVGEEAGVVVASETYVVDAHELHGAGDHVAELLQGAVGGEEVGVGAKAHYAAVLCEGAHHVLGLVALNVLPP